MQLHQEIDLNCTKERFNKVLYHLVYLSFLTRAYAYVYKNINRMDMKDNRRRIKENISILAISVNKT